MIVTSDSKRAGFENESLAMADARGATIAAQRSDAITDRRRKLFIVIDSLGVECSATRYG